MTNIPNSSFAMFGVKRPNNFNMLGLNIYRSRIGVFAPVPGRDPVVRMTQPVTKKIATPITREDQLGSEIQVLSTKGASRGKYPLVLREKLAKQAPLALIINKGNPARDGQGYFSFEIDRTLGDSYFDVTNLAISTKEVYADGLDTIAYFEDDGTPIPVADDMYDFGLPPASEKCKKVVIGLREMAAGAKFSVNLHVILKDGADILPTIFDPDIKNDGTGFGP